MIHGLSKHSTVGAGTGINYFLSENYFDKETHEWRQRTPAATLLEGNPSAMRVLCESLDFKHKYTSGVLSFSEEETALINSTRGMKGKIIEDFKDFAFAGVKKDCRNILLVQHEHTGRLEIHYMIPRIHLESGKYFNPFPPNYNGKQGPGNNNEFILQNDSFVDQVCNKYGLQNPRDTKIRRSVELPQFDPQRNIKKQVVAAIDNLIDAGAVSSREDMLIFLQKQGAEITRKGHNYFSFKFEGMSKAAKLEGELYSEQPFSEIAKRHSKRDAKFEAERAGTESRYSETLTFRSTEVESRHRIPAGVAERAEDRFAKSSAGLQKTHKELSEIRDVINNFSPPAASAARNLVNQNKLIAEPLINIPKTSPRSIVAPNISTGNKVHDELLAKYHNDMAGAIKKDILYRQKLSGDYAKLAKETIKKIESAVKDMFSFAVSMYTGQNFYSPGKTLQYEFSELKLKVEKLIEDIKLEVQLAKKTERHIKKIDKLSVGEDGSGDKYRFGFAIKTKIKPEELDHGKNSDQQAERHATEPAPAPTLPGK
ncbi:relaxase/mobilization nuclease [Pseudomonas baetica]|uniref:relaxase/mobilization nuclease domain-containing protein n=1 Tax=Pseudomonas baetica TaxID=674054 RepID=UPI000C2B66DD|nr:relaxase/mobilization nuclease domain-containing protein [Pseudomonas baetica]PTC20203.1 relaxase/mobilization nuclease [Pseudomonas baetica]